MNKLLPLPVAAVAMLIAVQSVWAISPEVEAELSSQVQQELQEIIVFLVPEERFCTEYVGFDYPVPLPTAGVEELTDEVERIVTTEGRDRYPDNKIHEFYREALGMYSLYELGKPAEAEKKNGEIYTGLLREINDLGVLIDNNTILFREMTPASLVRFRKDLSERQIDKHVQYKMEDWKAQREAYERQIYESREEQIFTEAGYMKRLGKWLPRRDYFEERLAAQRASLADRLRPLLATRVYYQAGYRLYNGVWLTQEEIQQRLELEATVALPEPEPTEAVNFAAEMDLLNAENAKATASTSIPPSALFD